MHKLTRFIIILLLTGISAGVILSVKASYDVDLIEKRIQQEKRLQEVQMICYTLWKTHSNYSRCLQGETIIPDSGM